jgi:hypothetical protein
MQIKEVCCVQLPVLCFYVVPDLNKLLLFAVFIVKSNLVVPLPSFRLHGIMHYIKHFPYHIPNILPQYDIVCTIARNMEQHT